MNSKTNEDQTEGDEAEPAASLTLEARPERRMIRSSGSFRHVDYLLRVAPEDKTNKSQADRPELTLGLVLDRSGSMHGDKLETAKAAALAVLGRLEARDQVAVVVFDDRIDVLQPLALVSGEVRQHVKAKLGRIAARGSTALHEGWLTGCKTIAGDELPDNKQGISRCFLLTDGLANIGVIDREQIASEAAGVRSRAGIGTSTFGIGQDYDESLLAPMAVAGGGQFHHLRRPEEIASTFVGELGELLTSAAQQVRLELQLGEGTRGELISEYWPNLGAAASDLRSIRIGDLMWGEERHVVVRFDLPKGGNGETTVTTRLVWSEHGTERCGVWQETRFTFADHAICDAEQRDAAVMRWVGLHHASRAKRLAAQMSARGEWEAARRLARRVAERIAEYAGDDVDLRQAIRELRDLDAEMEQGPLTVMAAKEHYFTAQRVSRSQRDHR